MVVHSPFPPLIVKDETVDSFVTKDFVKFGNEPALIDSSTGKRYTYRDLIRIKQSISCGIYAAGLRKGDVVAICSPNCPEYICALLGIIATGGIVSGVNPMYIEAEISHHFEDSGAKFVITSAANREKCTKAAAKLGDQVKQIYVFHDEDPSTGLPFSDLMNFPCDGTTPNTTIYPKLDVVLLPYSSGTTGVPKGVMLTHYNEVFIYTILSSGNYFLAPQRGEYQIGILPFSHIYGMMMVMVCLRNGCCMITMPKYDSAVMLNLIQTYKVKKLAIVPPIFLFLAKDPMVDKYDVSSLEAIGVGAAPVGHELSEELLERLPHVKFIQQGYGMTECGGVSHICPPTPLSNAKHGSCGVVLPEVECKIVDIVSGKELGAKENGEIWVRSVGVMKGYHNRPDATAETVDKDLWLHTGDIGHYDEDGYFFIVDRLKELIKVKGFQVAPAELEDLLLAHHGIRDAAVIGIPDLASGELPKAFVVRSDPSVTETNVMEFINSKVAHFKRLKGVQFIDELPKSLSGKILRRELREKYIPAEKTSVKAKL